MATLFEASGSGWKLEIVGKLPDLPPFLVTVPNSSIEAGGVSQMTRIDTVNDCQKPIVSGESTEPLLYEAVGYDVYFERDDPSISIKLPAQAAPRRLRPKAEHYFLNFGNSVGFADITISGPPGGAFIRFEVFSRKVDYRTDYLAMRDDISGILRNLAMAANSRTYGLAFPVRSHNPTLVEWFALVRIHFDEFMKISHSISKDPHLALVPKDSIKDTERARRVTRQVLNRALRRPNHGPIHPQTGFRLPRRINEATSKTTFDTPENRYFKALLSETFRNIRTLARTAESGDEDADRNSEERFFDSIREELKGMENQLRGILRLPFLSNVANEVPKRPNSMVFYKHPQYARFDKLCRVLNCGLSFSGDIVPIGVKDTALLYEYWCFLKIVNLLEARFDLEEQSVVKIKRMRTVVALEKGRASTLRFKHKKTGKYLYVLYNRMFNRLPTTSQKPDNVIQFASDDRFYIFDAKYRIKFDRDYLKKYGKPGPLEEDINTMHRYRDAIAIPHPITLQYQRGVVIGAAVLFPHPDETDYLDHHFHKSLEQVEIGGIPFLPSSTSIFEAKIDQLLSLEFANDFL